MKTLGYIFIMFVFISCGGGDNKTESTDTKQDAPATADLMKEEAAYDATRIDPNAKVVEFTLKAEGNTMTEMRFDPKEIKVPAGSTVKIKFVNKGTDAAMIHNFLLIEEGSADAVAAEALKAGQDKNYVPSMSQVLYGSILLQPKAETEFSIPAPAKGVYDFICTYPGHYKMMNGKFVVE